MQNTHTDLPGQFAQILCQLVAAENYHHLLWIAVEGHPHIAPALRAGLTRRHDIPQLSVIEADPASLEQVQHILSSWPDTRFYRGFSLPDLHYPDADTLVAQYQSLKGVYQRAPVDYWLERLEQEQAHYARSPQGALLEIIQAPSPPDFVILDGSEFTSYADYQQLQTAKIFILTGVNSFRNHMLFQELAACDAFFLMYQNWQEGSGYAVFKRWPPLQPGMAVVIHTRNEAANLPACLASVEGLPVYVIDMDSTDTTRELARQAGAQVIPHLPDVFVDEARNFGLAQVEYEWTLVLDADERLTPDLRTQLEALMTQPNPAAGYWIPRQNFFFGQWVERFFPDYQLRFFRTGKAAWTGMIHDFARVRGETRYLPAEPRLALQHYSYTTVADFLSRQLYYATHTVRQYQHLPASLTITSHTIRAEFQRDLEKLQKQIQDSSLSDLDWLVQTLYFFSNYVTAAHLFEVYAGFKPQPPIFLSAYSYLKNGVLFDYPFRESILSVIDWVDEMVIGYATDCEDNTRAELEALARQYPKLRLFPSEVWCKNRGQKGEVIRWAAEEAMQQCQGEWLWHIQADEVYHEADLPRLKDALRSSQGVAAYRFPILHFYGDYQTLISEKAQEIGWYQRCIRLARRGQTQHIKDAWTQMLNPQAQGEIRDLEIRIFHYGHVRQAEAMRLKSSYMEQLYAPLPQDFQVCPPGEYVYDRVPQEYLQTFTDSHPQTMRKRQARSILTPLSQQPQKPRILIISRHHRIRKGFGITLQEIFATGLLHTYFELHHLAWHYSGPDMSMDGVMVYGCQPGGAFGLQRLKHLLLLLEPAVVLLHADPHFFISYLPILEAWQGAVLGWFPIDYNRDHNPSAVIPVFQRCQRILCLSQYGVDQVRKDYAGPLEVVPLGVNTRRFYPVISSAEKQRLRKQLHWPEEAFVFLVVANNFWRKGLEYAIEAFYQLKRQAPNLAARSFLYLHTEFSEALDELIQAYDLRKHVRISQGFHPYHHPFSEQQLLELYQASDALLLTSLGEGFGMPLLEAQACGLPVIAPEHSSIPEVVQDAGLRFRAPGRICGQSADSIVWLNLPDPQDAARKMAQLITDPKLVTHLGQQGLRRAALYTWERSAEWLAAALGLCSTQGKPEFHYEEPRIIAV